MMRFCWGDGVLELKNSTCPLQQHQQQAACYGFDPPRPGTLLFVIGLDLDCVSDMVWDGFISVIFGLGSMFLGWS